MGIVTGLLGSSTIIGIIQLIIGKWLKDNPKFPNTFIPVMTFIAAVLGFTLTPVAAHAAAFLAIPDVASVVLLALAQTHAIVGTHSMFKNTIIPIAKSILSLVVNKLG